MTHDLVLYLVFINKSDEVGAVLYWPHCTRLLLGQISIVQYSAAAVSEEFPAHPSTARGRTIPSLSHLVAKRNKCTQSTPEEETKRSRLVIMSTLTVGASPRLVQSRLLFPSVQEEEEIVKQTSSTAPFTRRPAVAKKLDSFRTLPSFLFLIYTLIVSSTVDRTRQSFHLSNKKQIIVVPASLRVEMNAESVRSHNSWSPNHHLVNYSCSI